MLDSLHHIGLVSSDRDKICSLYVDLLGFTLFRESYSPQKKRRKLELHLNGQYLLEVFIPDQKGAVQPSDPLGVVHLAFAVENVSEVLSFLQAHQIQTSGPFLDQDTGKQYGFFYDPDHLKLECYER